MIQAHPRANRGAWNTKGDGKLRSAGGVWRLVASYYSMGARGARVPSGYLALRVATQGAGLRGGHV